MRNDFNDQKYHTRPKHQLHLISLSLIAVVAYGVARMANDDATDPAATPLAQVQQQSSVSLAIPLPPDGTGVISAEQKITPVPPSSAPMIKPVPALETSVPGRSLVATGKEPSEKLATLSTGVSLTPVATVKSDPIQPPAETEIGSDPEPKESIATSDRWLKEKVKAGDSLARIFTRLNLSPGLLHNIINSSKEAKTLARIRPGQTLEVHLDSQGKLLELIHQRSAIESLQVVATEAGFSTTLEKRTLESRIAQAQGTIASSLYQGAKRAGLDDAMVMELANIFGWDIDFALEIRAGDHFSLIYEERYLNGKKYRNGQILAAEFVNRGKVFRAVRYVDDKGNGNYYSPDGSSMRKAFLRAPVDFRRISSRFTKARWHPVLGKKRPHRGVDYAAATGTPIKAAGDGRVIFRGRKGGYGNTVIIQHGNQSTTLYGHMSKFRRSVKKGSRVNQGQVIGYVGKTGLATGPHLHYEFRVNGVHRNPLTVKLPAAAPINKKYRSDFKARSQPLLARLEQMSNTVIARAE
jgi:murein DD-endopeptidase MepM/ murein hydrolase activator NlpD